MRKAKEYKDCRHTKLYRFYPFPENQYTHFYPSKFSVPRKIIDTDKSDLLVLKGLRMKIQLLEGQKSS